MKIRLGLGEKERVYRNNFFTKPEQKRMVRRICDFLKDPENCSLEKWKEQVSGLLDGEKKDKRQWMASCLLALAAERGAMEAFLAVGSIQKPGSILWNHICEYNDQFDNQDNDMDEWRAFPQREAFELQELFQKNGPFLTRKGPFLEVLLSWSRDAPLPKGRRVFLQGQLCQTNAPDLWLAVISGDTEIVNRIRDCEGLQGMEYRMELAEDRIYWTLDFYRDRYAMECGYYFDKRWAYDLFTAAILSGSREMVGLIVEILPEIRWNRALEMAVASAGEEMTGWLLEHFPELLGYIQLSAIWRHSNGILLKAWMECCEKPREAVEELREYFQRKSRDLFIQGWASGHDSLQEGEPERWKKQEEFFRLFSSWEYAAEIQEETGREILLWIEARTELDRKELPEYQRSLLEFLYQNYGDKKIDCTEYLLDNKLQNFLFRLTVLRGRIARADQYRIQEDGMLFNGQGLERWMRGLQPVPLRGETDPITRGVLKQNNWRLLAVALRFGYVGKENALALYEYAAGLPHCSDEILQKLIFLSADAAQE